VPPLPREIAGGPLGILIGHGHDLHVLQLLVGADVHAPHEAEPDDADARHAHLSSRPRTNWNAVRRSPTRSSPASRSSASVPVNSGPSTSKNARQSTSPVPTTTSAP